MKKQRPWERTLARAVTAKKGSIMQSIPQSAYHYHLRDTEAQKLLAARLFETDLVLMQLLVAAGRTEDPSAALAHCMQQWLAAVQAKEA